MSLVIGIDPSAKKIAVVAHETVTKTTLVRVGGLYAKGQTRQDPRSLGAALTFMSDCLEELEAIAPADQRFAYVESPLVGRGGSLATIKQAYVGGIIRGCLDRAGFTTYDVNVSSWRKSLGITGKGTVAIKNATRLHVMAEWPKVAPEVTHDADLTDAAAICLHGVGVVAKADAIRRDASRDAARTPRRRVQRSRP